MAKSTITEIKAALMSRDKTERECTDAVTSGDDCFALLGRRAAAAAGQGSTKGDRREKATERQRERVRESKVIFGKVKELFSLFRQLQWPFA